MAETKSVNETVSDVQDVPETVDYIEYLGEEPHGTTFLTSHTLPRGDALWKRNKMTVSKAVTFERDPLGPPVGQSGNRLLVRVDDLPEGTLAVLEKSPGYKRVSE